MTRWTRFALLGALTLSVATGLGESAADAHEPRAVAKTESGLVEGSRVKTRRGTTLYFVDGGRLRPMRYVAYKNLFQGWGGIRVIPEAPEELLGENVRGDTRLLRIHGEEQVWYIDNGREKRPVRTFHLTGFASGLIEGCEAWELDRYYEGDPVGFERPKRRER